MTTDTVRKQATWLYGILVGLALKEGFALVIPHVIDTQPPMHIRAEHFAEIWRLCIFSILAVRFYFGAVNYFDDVYSTKADEFPTTSFASDFLFGFFHFVLFLALAYAIPTHDTLSAFNAPEALEQDTFRKGVFLGLVTIILFYDLLWLVINWGNSTASYIKKWAVFNCITLVIMLVIYVIIFFWYFLKGQPFDYGLCESVVLVPVAIASGLDVLDQMVGKSFVRQLLDRISGMFNSN